MTDFIVYLIIFFIVLCMLISYDTIKKIIKVRRRAEFKCKWCEIQTDNIEDFKWHLKTIHGFTSQEIMDTFIQIQKEKKHGKR